MGAAILEAPRRTLHLPWYILVNVPYQSHQTRLHLDWHHQSPGYPRGLLLLVSRWESVLVAISI